MQKITPFLWFDNNAEQAAKFYVSVFKKQAKILRIMRNTEASPGPEGAVMIVEFQLFGQTFTGLNGGPMFKFTEAVSFAVNCKTQREVDYYWEKLSAGGRKSQCGWLKDKFGLSWQVVPTEVIQLLCDKDRAKANRVTAAVMEMSKIDIKKAKAAAKAR